jgi:hypothetical protein
MLVFLFFDGDVMMVEADDATVGCAVLVERLELGIVLYF